MIDELSVIAAYMALQMQVNANSPIVKQMASLNATSSEVCIAEYLKGSMWRKMFGTTSPQACVSIVLASREAALLMWTLKVMQNAEWDHKPLIRGVYRGKIVNDGEWHGYGATLFYYDVWSNIHYGYVGLAAGFSDAVLLDGAGLEQIGSDFLRKRWPVRCAGVRGLRAFDDEFDRNSISMGMDMWRLKAPMSAGALVRAIVKNKENLRHRPVPSPNG